MRLGINIIIIFSQAATFALTAYESYATGSAQVGEASSRVHRGQYGTRHIRITYRALAPRQSVGD